MHIYNFDFYRESEANSPFFCYLYPDISIGALESVIILRIIMIGNHSKYID